MPRLLSESTPVQSVSKARIREGKRCVRKPALRQPVPEEHVRLARTPIPFVAHPDFGRRTFSEELAPLPSSGLIPSTASSLPAYLAKLYETPLLTKDDEQALFTQMNWLRYRAERLRQSLRPSQPSAAKITELQRLIQLADTVRNRIVQANLRLVVSLARKFADGQHSLEDLISEGHLPLIRAVELFDISRGNRFSTYATWAVRNHFARHVGLQKKRGEIVGYGDGELFETAPDLREDDCAGHQEIDRQRRMMSTLLPRLSARDQHVVEARFGLNDHDRTQSLSEIAGELGLSKERVRQLVLQAVEKLRDLARELKSAR